MSEKNINFESSAKKMKKVGDFYFFLDAAEISKKFLRNLVAENFF